MESEYDRKFEDMKKYIPFLESMIKRLESTSTLSANPRQAQLDKIRSLRDLLLDKKKRMKMENLLKCEQVLINLYAKVEQRDTLPNVKKSSGSPRMDSNTQLEIVRNKLKRVSKIQDGADTLPEIVRASDVEDVCMRGSVEPALFQRRPHKKSPTLSDISSSSQDKVKSPEQNSKRKYTRVLYSPEPDARIRSSNPDSSLDVTLFSRRSPKKSSSSHNKKEAKKIHKTPKKTKDLNITLKVPQESLNSLNTKDILSRIITCNDNDVDIDTLRGLRSQILGELKQTGTKDDISDLILKSYAGKKTINRGKEEVEEGELSDSESEAIESIYGSLVLVDKVKTKNDVTCVPEKDQPRKIQICLVINSREGESSSKGALKANQSIKDDFDLEMFDETENNKSQSKTEDIKVEKPKSSSCGEKTSDLVNINDDGDNTAKKHETLTPTKVTESTNSKDRAITNKVVGKKEANITNKDVKTKKISSNSGNKNETYDLTKDAIKEINAMAIDDKTDGITKKDVPNKKEDDIVIDKNEPNETNEYVSSKDDYDINEPGVTDTDQTNKKSTDKFYDKNEASVVTLASVVVEDENIKKVKEKVVDKNEVIVTNKLDGSPKLLKQNNKNSDSSVQFTPNFYKPVLVNEKSAPVSSFGSNKQNNCSSQVEKSTTSSIAISSILDKNECVKIPLLDEPIIPHQPAEKDIDAQIDILQALKNEILGDNILPVPDVVTPLLHQPKVTKVSQVQGIMPKKRISIEKYKEKTTPLFLNACLNDDSIGSPLRDDNAKKQSLKLTEKECERFNFPAKIDIDDDVSSEDECQKEFKMSSDEIYKDFAPKSPDNEDIQLMETTQPVIIPIDPVKAPVVTFKADVDMRTLPILSPKDISLTGSTTPLSSMCQKSREHKLNEILDKSTNMADRNQLPLMDPRTRRDSNQSTSIDSSNSGAMNLGKISNTVVAPNVICAPNMTPSMTPISRSFDMTPNRLNDFEDVNSLHKHVYAPSFSLLDSRDSREHSILSDVCSPQESEVGIGRRKSRWEENNDHDSRSSIPQNEFNTQRSKYADTHKSDKNSDNTDDSIRGQGSMTPLAQFGWSEGSHVRFGRPEGPVPLMMLNLVRPECPLTPSHPFGRSECTPAPTRSVNKSDMPGTPSHPFGRVDCPMTPSHPFGRSDCPTTPIHPFGRADCPATPSHSFGRIDCPPSSSNPFTRIDFPVTPSHSFGMTDCPTTPSHPFGRTDCPTTPSHPFGRLEGPTTPSHPFGRIDGGVTPNYSLGRAEQSHNISMGQQYSKDPRLNRRFDVRSQRDERDNRNYKDRGFNTRSSYEMHHRAFSRSDSYTHHDRDDEGRSRSMSRSERNFGHGRSRDNYFDHSDNRDLYKYDNRSRPRERYTEDRYRLDRNAGRNPDSRDTHARSQSKPRSITRNDNRETENDNTVSIKSHAGRLFTIDTSVNSTFQDLLKKKGLEILSEPFDSRKQRATSVGRSEASSYGKDRTLKSTSSHLSSDDSEYRSRDYRRASSVGRDLHDKYDSFQKAKTDFKNYQEIIARQDEKRQLSKNATAEHNKKSNDYSDSQNYRSDCNTPKPGKQAYSARNNYRDPRMRREYDDKNSHRDTGNYYDKNKHGINYSSNNLAKGAVLGSGYGVKNYKIPKIKRPTSKVQEEEKLIDEKKAVETKNKNDELKEITNSDKERCSDVEKNVTEGTPEKRLTRSSKNKNKDLPVLCEKSEIRKRKRAVIHDSSSDTETYEKDAVSNNILSSEDEKSSISKYSQNNQDKEAARETKGSKDTSETEIFFDNVISDPVIDNINALIADLDNHIDNSKAASTEDFKDIKFDDDLSNISNSETISLSKENTFDALFNKKINVHREINVEDENLIKENSSCTDTLPKTLHSKLDNTNCKSPDISFQENESEIGKNQVHNLPHPIPNSNPAIETHERNVMSPSLQISEGNKSASNIDATVSTTKNDKLMDNALLEGIEKSVETNAVKFETSAADSTNEITSDNTKEHNLPDSTNDINDINSLVSSSLSVAEVPTKDVLEHNLPQQDTVPPLDSIGSLLSILKDKSKIHQLLCMIGEKSGDNDKIKRKLEKLSEIVSDDEEEASVKTTDVVDDVNKPIKDGTFEENHSSIGEKSNDITLENAEQSLNVLVNPDTNADEPEAHEQPLINNAIESKDDQNKITRNKGKVSKNTKGKYVKAKKPPRATRVATGQIVKKPPTKKPSRELQKLREDIKEMFLTDEMLNSTGIRMCRLAKLVDEKSLNRKEETPQDPKPFVMIEKIKPQDKNEEAILIEKPIKKKPSPKTKRKASTNEDLAIERSKLGNTKGKTITKISSIPKSKIKASSKQEEIDPYEFETDSVDTSTVKSSESEDASDCETNSIASSRSFGSSEILADLQKKTKRKRRGKAWQTGIIKPKYKKKKSIKPIENPLDKNSVNVPRDTIIPDNECFIDKYYCFEKNVGIYPCRLCEYAGDDIILHFKKQHPHIEIPLSRMNPAIAKEAIKQCQEVNFPAISKISTDRYVCRFCYKEFSKSKAVLETFFWHVVSMHTGEYKQACTECANDTCYFNLDIPPPPKDNTGQLIGYLCGKCNYTQVSLENLKTHVIGRHNDEQTDVYTINLAVMTKKTLKTLAKHQATIAARVLRSSRSNQSSGEAAEDHEELVDNTLVTEPVSQSKENVVTVKIEKKDHVTSMQSKIVFESEENVTPPDLAPSHHDGSIDIKQENVENEDIDEPSNSSLTDHLEPDITDNSEMETHTATEVTEPGLPDDVMAHAHFKICYKESGAKEYVCCVNGTENHYKTTLLISMKKHVQSKHSEHWDGFCVLCKLIVTAQGLHHYSECLQHFLDKHMDEFPVLELTTELSKDDTPSKNTSEVTAEVPKPYINVRPLNQLISSTLDTEITNDTTTQFPKIQSVVSLGAHTNLPLSSPSYPVLCTETPEEKQYRYEDWQAEVMSKKHRVVLNSMMAEEKLVKVFKCTGKFCSFATDNAEKALLHATTHQRIGGEGALNCSYCDFDAANNGIDLVMHVFKAHGKCPYTCKLCFYRATSSQLVSSHISRLHSERQSFDAILQTTTVATPVADDDNLMSREEAVPSYVCGHPSSEGDDTCKFRTFTPGQFGEHLIRHPPPYPCNMCGSILPCASELVHHMKGHGLRLYQCTSCVFGADNEPEMLAHAAARHPDRLPQAYLRVVTNKDGSAEFRVLPRAILNKLKSTSRKVISSDTDNPVREAERSLALEKLIGHTESVTSIEPVQPTNEADDDTNHDTGIIEDSELLLTENIENEPSPPPADLTTTDKSNPSAAVEIEPKSIDENVSLVVKKEPGVKAPNISSETVIYCLDSDDEESTPRVIDISDDDLISVPTVSTSKPQEPIEYKKKPLHQLFLCPSCLNVNRNLCGFKRHVGSCLASSPYGPDNIQCPHENCHRKLHGVIDIANHYLQDHADRKITVYACGICKAKYKTVTLTKKHMKDVHKSTHFSISLMTSQGDTEVYTVTEKTPIIVNKRKSSDAAKQKRYGPQDVDQLPINPILESLVFCSLCEFGTKVRLNMVRHLQLHAESQPAPQTAPVNPVPHLETNERYFDRMVNLASSSISTRAPDKPSRPDVPVPSVVDTGRYPKFVPDRVRYTCGSKNCSYISVDEGMLRIHWETLHSNTTDYKCVHCPPHQYLDQTKPLTAARIIGHLKMHEENLYACSACSYYHFKRVAVEKHLQKCPKTDKDGQIMVVRECGVTPSPAPAPSSAPSMDLKPWQCGLCSYKSLLRPEVTEHCFKIHQSKMQFKCNYCPFRTSVVENVTKHQTNAHPDKTEDVFYYYYREGSIPDDANGTPRWMRQKQNSGITEPVVKSEVPEPSTSSALAPVASSVVAPVASPPVNVNLSIVKQEVEDTEISETNTGIEGSIKRFGKFCEPSGTKYKCPLCTTVVEDQAEAMQSHLYEELKYRKWGCSICSYKAFHKTGLTEHLKSEHHRQFQEPKELPADLEVENWVAALLEYQKNIIEKNTSSQIQTDATPSTSKESQDIEVNLNELEQAFGSFGTPRDCLFCCPKCSCTLKDESVMKEHLESELTKIRWCCSHCSHMSHTYHEAQFHCKTAHPGESARPREALRSADKRAAWVHAVLRTQKDSMTTTTPSQPVAEKLTDLSDLSDNSLLVVRYEERVPTPEDVTRRKRTAPVDSDEEKLVIDESEPAKKKAFNQKACPHCDYKTKWTHTLREHILRHYNLKPYKCCICNLIAHRPQLVKHFEKFHPAQPFRIDPTPMPMGPPNTLVLSKRKGNITEEVNQICLHCGKSVLPSDLDTHKHGDVTQEFAKKGEVVVKCCICLVLRLDVSSLHEHHNACHPDVPVNYAFFKLQYDSLECFYCSYCNHRFSYIRDLRSHHRATHSGMMMKYTIGPPQFPELEEDANAKRKNEEALTATSPKRVAKKSTTKLPHNTVAKKSTTKLPYSVCDDDEEFSFYGTKPLSPDNYNNVTTLMTFCNTLVPFTFKKLREIINIEPVVLVKDEAK